MTYVTCRLTAKNRDQLRNPTVGNRVNRVWATFFSVCRHVARLDDVTPAKWLFSSTSTYHPTDLLTARGVAHVVVHGTTGSTSYEIRFHPSSDWRALEACCRPWTWWCNDATDFAYIWVSSVWAIEAEFRMIIRHDTIRYEMLF